MRLKTSRSFFITAFLIFTLLSCNENLNHNITLINDQISSREYKIEFHNDHINSFYELNFKCLNPISYSKDSMEFISFKSININSEELILSKENKGFTIKNENNLIHKVDYPKNSKNKVNSISKIKKSCISEYNELLRIKYDMNTDSITKENYIKVIAYSSSPFTKDDNFNWNYFSSNKDNLFEIYKRNLSCDKKWKIKMAP